MKHILSFLKKADVGVVTEFMARFIRDFIFEDIDKEINFAQDRNTEDYFKNVKKEFEKLIQDNWFDKEAQLQAKHWVSHYHLTSDQVDDIIQLYVIRALWGKTIMPYIDIEDKTIRSELKRQNKPTDWRGLLKRKNNNLSKVTPKQLKFLFFSDMWQKMSNIAKVLSVRKTITKPLIKEEEKEIELELYTDEDFDRLLEKIEKFIVERAYKGTATKELLLAVFNVWKRVLKKDDVGWSDIWNAVKNDKNVLEIANKFYSHPYTIISAYNKNIVSFFNQFFKDMSNEEKELWINYFKKRPRIKISSYKNAVSLELINIAKLLFH